MSTATSSSSQMIGISRTIWNKCNKESILALLTPIVVCLAAGDLNLDSFRHFIAQDVHFLRAFAQAFHVAEDYADDDDAKSAIEQLRNAVSQELKTHDSFLQEWGSDPMNERPLNPATTKYTDFLLATTSGVIDRTEGAPIVLATPFEKTKIAPYTLGAITPCMRLYAFIGKELKAHLGTDDSNHLYKKWIDKYSSESFEVSAQRTEDLLDTLSVSLTSNELDIVEKLYRRALRLEIEFLTAQPLVQNTVIPFSKELKPAEWHLLLFSAFDQTCSQVDSSVILAELSILAASKSDQNQPENQITGSSTSDLRNKWEVLSKKYNEEYGKCIATILKSNKVKRFRYKKLCKGLEVLGGFEKRVNARVIKSGVLKGVNLEHINKAKEQLVLQDGYGSFLQKLVQNKNLHVNVNVLSYCWCGDLIRSAFSSGGLHFVNVHANELIYDGSVSTGEMDLKVQSPWDKSKAFTDILEGFKDNKKKKLTVYIGRSVGDLLCLVKADVGVVIDSCSSLREVGGHLGISFVPLFEALVSKQKAYIEGIPMNWNGQSGVLYTASSWYEIQALILGS